VKILQNSFVQEQKKNKRTSETTLDLARLFQEYYPRVYNYLRYRTNSLEDAEDLMSTVFERAYTYRTQFDGAKGSFLTWLFRIAHNTLANYYRTYERYSAWVAEGEPPPDIMTPEPSLEAQVVKKEMILQLLQGLERLGERDREVISLKFAGKLSNKEIGEIMDMKEKTVSVVLLRAMRRLREQIKGEAVL
jgi:RNA polymerase sigma-70 factor (ECF subfamily)